MKTISRILVILLAAGVVVTAARAMTHDNAVPRFERGEPRFRPEGESENEEFDAARPGSFPDELNPGERPENLMDSARSLKRQIGRFVPLGMIKDFGVVAGIVAVIVSAEYVLDRKRKKRVVKVPDDPSIE